MTYQAVTETKNLEPNYVILFRGQYFATRAPDSGLSIDSAYLDTISEAPSIAPVSVDIQTANTPIGTYTFGLQDRGGVLSALFNGDAFLLTGEQVTIWTGFTTGSFDFADYEELPPCFIKTVTYNGDLTYSFSVVEYTDRMSTSAFSIRTTLPGGILDSTTSIALPAAFDLAAAPSSGTVRIDDEFIGYTSVDLVNGRLEGCLRGLLGSVAAAHDLAAEVQFVQDVTDNPLTILLKLLVSSGGGGSYDVLDDGCALPESAIDVTGIEALRDSLFAGWQFNLTLYAIDNVLSFLETEIFQPCNVRLTMTSSGKLSVVVLDRSVCNPDRFTIDESSIVGSPQWTVDDADVVNQLEVSWDYDEVISDFRQITSYSDAASIAKYGARPVFSLETKGIKASLGGQAIVDAYSTRFLKRFSSPKPTVEFDAQMNISRITVGEKALVVTSQLPTTSGDYVFRSELEVISRGIKHAEGSVPLRLAFTSYSDVRQAFIAPTHTIIAFSDQKTITLPSGAGSKYRVGWPMRLFDLTLGVFNTGEDPNVIASIAGDVITFQSDFVTTLVANAFRLTLPFYNETVDGQRVFAFIAPTGSNFPDGFGPYETVF